jgi:hypothetical protein
MASASRLDWGTPAGTGDLTRARPCRLREAIEAADTSTLTPSRVMMPCDWIGIITIRNDTFRNTLINGTMATRPGPLLTRDPPEAEHDGPLAVAVPYESQLKAVLEARHRLVECLRDI